MRIDVDIRPLRDLRRRVESAAAADMPPLPLTKRLATESYTQTQERFGRRVAPDGRPWKPRVVSERYPALPHPLLEKTRRMRWSIQSFPDGDGIGQTSEPPYAIKHQRGEGNVPPRPFLGWSEGNVESLAGTAGDWLTGWWGERL